MRFSEMRGATMRRSKTMKRLKHSISVAAAFFVVTPGLASDLTGQASVIDGDTIEIHRTRIRIHGIDAPESSQLCRGADSNLYRCGQRAAIALADFIARRPVECVDIDQRTFNRVVAICTVEGVDIADWLVRNGLAVDWPKYSRGGYAEAQAEAQKQERGIWRGTFVEPWRYRKCDRSGGRVEECSDLN